VHKIGLTVPVKPPVIVYSDPVFQSFTFIVSSEFSRRNSPPGRKSQVEQISGSSVGYPRCDTPR